jgi:hypothetical protein
VALTPTGPRLPGNADGRVARRPSTPAVQRPRTAVPAEQPATVAAPRLPDPGYRLKTAITPEEIDRQIARLMALIANDNIDPDAPTGSYLNMLV